MSESENHNKREAIPDLVGRLAGSVKRNIEERKSASATMVMLIDELSEAIVNECKAICEPSKKEAKNQ